MHTSKDLEVNKSTGDNVIEVEEENAVEYEKVLEKIGFGKAQYNQIIIGGLITLTLLALYSSTGIISIVSQCEFQMSQSDKGFMMAAFMAGKSLSTFIWGYISDRVGRRAVLLYSTFAGSVLLFITVFVTNIRIFNTLNLLIGASFGAESVAMFPYISEFNTARHRDIVINYSSTFVSVAAIYVPAVAWLVLSFDWSLDLPFGITLRPWRLLIIMNLIPGLIGALLLIPFPESPKLLLARHKEKAAIKSIDWICKLNKGQCLAEALKVTNLKLRPEKLSENDVINSDAGGWSVFISILKEIRQLFYRQNRRNVFLCATASFFLFFSSNGMQVWYPEIVNRASTHSSNVSATVCEILNTSFNEEASMKRHEYHTECVNKKISETTYINNIILGCVFLVTYVLQGYIIKTLGLKKLLLSALGIAIFCGVLLQFVSNSIAILVTFCLFIIMPNLQIPVIFSALISLMPTHLRGKALGITMDLGFLGVIISEIMIGNSLGTMCTGTFIILTLGLLICALFVSFLPI